ncbi:hypothetical protein Godav_025329 [Gossypium davidsonii]|uniref:Uncharacterized protein n=1 Tax=Gossypium davidsonii TaxID=34287 RepID=A0A7J8TH27_GOSDV|nr:hypothetical protein [Gossypium davidsonii]
MAILQNLRDEDVEWKAPWMVPDEILYRCGDFDWVPLLGIRELLDIPLCSGKIREMSNAWKQIHWMKRFTVGATSQVIDRDHIMGEALAQIREVADHLQTLVVQADTLSVKYELESSQGKELASLLKKIRVLSIKAIPYIKDGGVPKKHDDSANTTVGWGNDKGKSPMANAEEGDNDGPLYPLGFTPPHIQPQADVNPRKSSITIRPQQFQAGASIPMNFQTRLEGHEIQKCTEFRALVQGMMDDKEMEFYKEVEEEGTICASESTTRVPKVNHLVVIISRPRNNEVKVSVMPKIIIQNPTTFSYKDNKKVSWNYECNITV